MKRGLPGCLAYVGSVFTIESFHIPTFFYMGIEPAQQGEICQTLDEIRLKWDKFLHIKTSRWASPANPASISPSAQPHNETIEVLASQKLIFAYYSRDWLDTVRCGISI